MSPKLYLIALLLCACTGPRMIQTSLYFGQAKPGGGQVTSEEWQRFKEGEIARVFKEGCTILPATGLWYDPEKQQQITEPTYVVVYFYKPSRLVSKQIDSLRGWYKTAFHQQSVLRVDKRVKAGF